MYEQSKGEMRLNMNVDNNKENKIKIKLTTAIILIIIAILCCGIIAIILSKNDYRKDEKSIQIGNKKIKEVKSNDFSFEFLKMEEKRDNMIYSPLSIKYALSMLEDGANGNTKDQIEKVIGNNSVKKYDNINDTMSLANAMYIKDSYSKNIKNEYKELLQNNYNAEIQFDTFDNAKNVNQWIENKTFGQIKNMLDDIKIKNKKVLLINTLAMNMEWKEQFDENNTYSRDFYLDDGNNIKVETMEKETTSNDISYYQNKNVTAISMDLQKYNNKQFEFIAIMPNNNVSKYIEDFNTDTLKKLLNKLKPASSEQNGIKICIPKFSFDYNLDLKEDLQNLGITNAFENDADFSNIVAGEFFVDDVLHKANIIFSESGIKAAASTVVEMTDGAIMNNKTKPKEIKIDRPFMYIIRDKITEEIWFVGELYKPIAT